MLVKKIIFLIFFTFSFGACLAPQKNYFYKKNVNEYITIEATLMDSSERNSPLNEIKVVPTRFATVKKLEKIEILSKKILIEHEGEKSFLEVTDGNSLLPYDQGIIIKEGTIIVHLGKIKIGNKIILDVPPIDLKNYFKLNVKISDSSEDIYYGNADGYKRNKSKKK